MNAEKRAQAAEKARALAEQKLTKMDVKLGGTELKLAEVESLNLAQVDEIADLKAALEAYEDKWYNAGFADAEGSVEPTVYQSRKHGFEKGWMATFQAMGVLVDSSLRNLEQIPFPEPSIYFDGSKTCLFKAITLKIPFPEPSHLRHWIYLIF